MRQTVRFLVVLILLSVARSGAATSQALEIKAVTFNIRYAADDDGPNAWPFRRLAVIDFIRQSGADFIGLQEALGSQVRAIEDGLADGFELISRSREVDPSRGESTPLVWNSRRWQIDARRQGTFWLSETPETPGSRSWQSSLPRVVTWARFVERQTSTAVWVFNTHFDHRSEEARLESARLLARRIGDWVPAGAALVVLGDLNAGEDSQPLRALTGGDGSTPVALRDTWRVLHADEASSSTFNGWGEGIEGPKIDFVLAPVAAVVEAAEIERRHIDGRPISDHWPVSAQLRFGR